MTICWDIDESTEMFRKTDVVRLIGANAVTNPSSLTDTSNPIYGCRFWSWTKLSSFIFILAHGRGFCRTSTSALLPGKTPHALFGDANPSWSHRARTWRGHDSSSLL